MAFLFDTDALCEPLRPRPAPAFLHWLRRLPFEDQFTSAISIGEMYQGAFRSPARKRHLVNLEARVLPSVRVLPFDVETARSYGLVQAELERAGLPLAEADLQIAATALQHGLTLVTGNLRHFERVPGLTLSHVLAEAREAAR